MAKVLSSFDFKGRPEPHPWDKWFNGQIWELKRGTDFDCKVETLVSNARAKASKRGFKLCLAVRDKNTVVIQAQLPKVKEAKKKRRKLDRP